MKMRNVLATAAAAVFLVMPLAKADLVVNQNLGTLGFGTVNLSGTTVGGANNASTYFGANVASLWDEEFVYRFTTTAPSVITMTSNDPNTGPNGLDNDFFLLNSLTTASVETATGSGIFVNQAVGVLPSQPASTFSGVEVSGGWGTLPAGTYFLSIDSFRAAATNASSATSFNVNLRLASTVVTTPTTVATVSIIDTSGVYAVPDQTISLTGGTPVKWIKVILGTTVSNAAALFLDIDTEGAINGAVTLDTEIGLYRADGTLVATDDDDGSGATSALSFGQTSPTRGPLTTAPATLAGAAGNGRDGTLVAGEYYLAIAGFNAAFAATGFGVTTTSTNTTATIPVNFRTNVVPEPSALALLACSAPLALRRRRPLA